MLKVLCFISFLWLASCSSPLLKKDFIQRLSYESMDGGQVIYYKKTVMLDSGGNVRHKVHQVMKIGSNLRSQKDMLYVFSGSTKKLISYNARVMTRSGDSYTFDLSDLQTVELSNASVISTDVVRIMPLTEVLSPGDLIETVYEHELTLPQLGDSFSPAEISLPAANISYEVILPAEKTVNYKVFHDTLSPTINIRNQQRIICFSWKKHIPPPVAGPLTFRNRYPIILSSFYFPAGEHDASRGWVAFGDWYLGLIRHRLVENRELTGLAREITRGLTTDKQKLDALFRFVQEEIRYEQVYLDKGGFIPNRVEDILIRKYGDCKDYTLLTHILAKSLDINTSIALCFRGRGNEFFSEMPVSQFNHAILHYRYKGRDYWYDGTNRVGIPGLTSRDLINQPALLIRPGASKLVTIREDKDNLLKIEGSLTKKASGLTGHLTISLKAQYAMDFFYYDRYLNRDKMKEVIVRWVAENIDPNLSFRPTDWSREADTFVFRGKAEAPNTLIILGNDYYFSLSRLMSKLLVDNFSLSDLDAEETNFYPGYSRLEVDLTLPGFREANPLRDRPFRLHKILAFDPGPFYDQGGIFLERIRRLQEDFSFKYKLLESNP